MDVIMEKEIIPEALPLFRTLSEAKRADLLRNAVVHGVSAGTILFEQGEVPNFQLVVLSGSVQLFGRSAEGREVLIEAVHAPDAAVRDRAERRVLDYNEDDVRATWQLRAWLRTLD